MARPATTLSVLLAACACMFAPAASSQCALAGQSRESLQAWKAAGFAVDAAPERHEQALALVACLGHPDPFVRDGLAFEALSTWMRDKLLDTPTVRALGESLLAQLDGEDPQGFRKPFAALVLSEVARTDRVQPWMSVDERARMVAAAADYIASVRDYRGYVDGEGWRHGIAHGADWTLQLALNPALRPEQVMSLLSALRPQVMPVDGHAYAFGEPGRLARPVAYAVARGDLDRAAVADWLAGLPADLGPRPADGREASWWMRRANLEDFLNALGALLEGETAPALVALAASVRETTRKLP